MMYLPKSQLVLENQTKTNFNLINKQAVSDEMEEKPSSCANGLFCFSWINNSGQRCSLWSGNLSSLITLFFNFKNVKNKELIYFPCDSDKVLTIFGGCA